MLENFFGKCMSKLTNHLFIKEVKGIENLPESRYILASNHASYIDIPVIETILLEYRNKWARFIARKDLMNDTYFRIATFLMEKEDNRVIRVDRNKGLEQESFQEVYRALGIGHIIAIFPEGGRSRDGKIRQGKTGMVRIALKSQVPIVPVGIHGTFDLMPKGSIMPKFKKNIVVNIGKPVYFGNYYKREIKKQILRKLTDKIMIEIAKLSDQRYRP